MVKTSPQFRRTLEPGERVVTRVIIITLVLVIMMFFVDLVEQRASRQANAAAHVEAASGSSMLTER